MSRNQTNNVGNKIKRFALIVIGRVQGVGYRFFTKENADMYGITGWVRNCFNGSVEIEAQGNHELLQHFCKELRKGPLLGHVAEIKVKEIAPAANEQEFTIRYS